MVQVTAFNVLVNWIIAVTIVAEGLLQTGISLMEHDCTFLVAYTRAVELTELTYVVVGWAIHQLAYIAVEFLSMSVTPQQERYCVWEYTLIKEVNT